MKRCRPQAWSQALVRLQGRPDPPTQAAVEALAGARCGHGPAELRWHAAPFLKKLVGLVHDPDREAFMRLAEVANQVGRLPDVSQRIHPGKHSVSVGSHDWNRFPNPKND